MTVANVVKAVVFALVLAAAGGCYHRPLPAAFLGAQGGDSPSESSAYTIQRGDLLNIKFFYNPELNEEVTVRPDGRITLQLANEIQADGLTPAQLTDALTAHYAPLIRDPEIAVIVRSFSGQRVYVDGEVNKAGMVALTDPMTLLQAISQAGGFKETAEPANILILRKGEDNRIVTAKVNLEPVLAGKRVQNDVMLLPNDIVLVPRSGIADVNLWVDQYIRKLIPFPIGIGLGLGY